MNTNPQANRRNRTDGGRPVASASAPEAPFQGPVIDGTIARRASANDPDDTGAALREANAAIIDDIESIEIREDGVEVTKRAKITMNYLGNPRAAAMLPEGAINIVGYVAGRAYDTRPEKLPDGGMSWSLIGEFVGESPDGMRVIQSGRLFLPAGIQEEIVAAVESGGGLELNLEIRTIKAKNPAGYSYDILNNGAQMISDRMRLHRQIIERRRRQMMLLTDQSAPGAASSSAPGAASSSAPGVASGSVSAAIAER